MSELSFKNFWYIACESHELKPSQTLARQILDEWIVLFRDENNRACAFEDRCIHRNAQLSKGWVKNGKLQCSYHGWIFDGEGKLKGIPSEGPNSSKKVGSRCAKTFECLEQDGFVYVLLEPHENSPTSPFEMPHYNESGYQTVRLFNKFQNSVINCAENYIDVPHTVFVHDKIFRDSLNEEITTKVIRENGKVSIEYLGESGNLGWFSWFLNPRKVPIIHIDTYHMPNTTCVKYIIDKKEFWITSQSIPISEYETWVWTDLTYKFGPAWLNWLARPFVHFQGQSVIDQDIEVLDNQGKVLQKYPESFSNASADVIHVLIESVYNEIKAGRDPRLLPTKELEVKFWI